MVDPNPDPNYITAVPVTTRTITSGGTTYHCDAVVGSGTESAVWRIKAINSADEDNVIVLWADGNYSYDNICANAESLEYS